MRAGDLFWFGDNVPTGYENPFAQPAFLLIFKIEDRTPGYDRTMLERLETMKVTLESERAGGAVFAFTALPQDHPARVFARRLPGAKVLAEKTGAAWRRVRPTPSPSRRRAPRRPSGRHR